MIKKVTNKQLMNKIEQIHDDIIEMDNENKKSKGINYVAIVLAFLAISVTALYQAMDIAPIWSLLLFFVFFGGCVFILINAF